MTPGQKKTLRVLLILAGLILLICLGLVAWEFHSLTLNDQASISEVMWLLWSEQPGPIMMVLLLVAHLLGWLGGHFFWQNKKTYDDIRKAGAVLLILAGLSSSGCTFLGDIITNWPKPQPEPSPAASPKPSPQPSPEPSPSPSSSPSPSPSPSPQCSQPPPGPVCDTSDSKPSCGCWRCDQKTGFKWLEKPPCQPSPAPGGGARCNPDKCWKCEDLLARMCKFDVFGKTLFQQCGGSSDATYLDSACYRVDEQGGRINDPTWLLGADCWPCSGPGPSPSPGPVEPNPNPGPSPSPGSDWGTCPCPPLVKWNIAKPGSSSSRWMDHSGNVVSGPVLGGSVSFDSTPKFLHPNNLGTCNEDHHEVCKCPGGGWTRCEDPRGPQWSLEGPSGAALNVQGDWGYGAKVKMPSRGRYTVKVCPQFPPLDQLGRQVPSDPSACSSFSWEVN